MEQDRYIKLSQKINQVGQYSNQSASSQYIEAACKSCCFIFRAFMEILCMLRDGVGGAIMSKWWSMNSF